MERRLVARGAWNCCRQKFTLKETWLLDNVKSEEAVYVPAWKKSIHAKYGALPKESRVEIPIACARIGKGYLGFVGDVNGQAKAFSLIFTMCGLPRMDD